ncbi:MAG: histidinol-phosphate transaminase [Gammaproteobacteria bacterium]|nr:histidinol-phosphate transaminase [Rhodocyclaceae bacterium]MBU3908514.1 histidinol-phosphate transaminase [Gammaproteobacteria bacterium]MBU3990495.1 histidinol-phosphate transaminase [Gammaproteobacteria bacterium]MBU4004542.1 histidinol-phosphate transaminase [Gammaproteobacteria bacterium]MBU4021145.1 histidinol-phosphate transaminase [Gammaproteobacteria bacterium]
MSISAQALLYVKGISPYVPGKPITELAREMGLPVERIVKLASNENPLGMSPKARAAVTAALDGLERYPDQFELIRALAERLGVGQNQVVLGNGSNDVLDLAARVFLSPGRSAVFSQHAFAVYPLATLSTGAECVVAPAKHYGHDLTAMRAAIRPDTRLVWIANPNNPTGNFLPYPDVRAFLESVPGDVAVVLDEAYNDYLPPAERVDSVAWLKDFPNLIITRTFSKIHGLAGLRVGFAVASAELADLLNRVRQPFNLNNLALVAARAALDDHLFVAESYQLNRRGMEQIVAGLKRLGLEHIPSHGNFVTFAVSDGAAVNLKLLKQGVIVRPIGGYGLPNHLRVTIGLETENARFLEALETSL